MTITNEDRYALQERANSVLGREHAATMMELLPPVGWADVATKSDLDAQSETLTLKLRLEWAAAEQRISWRHGVDGDGYPWRYGVDGEEPPQ